MTWELLTDTPPLLREGHYITFQGGWPAPTAREGYWFRVEIAQPVKYDVNSIIASAASVDLDFSIPAGGGVGAKNLSLMPTNPLTAYELLLSLKGNCLVYPMYNNSYYLRLEATNVVPSVTDARLRYLGFYDEEDSPLDHPRLREIITYNQQAPVLRLYNDQFLDESMILRFIVNRLKLAEAHPPPEEIRRVARVARYFPSYSW